MKEQEALLLIEEMISKTKNDLRDDGRYYLLWGWAVFVAAVMHFLLELWPQRHLPSPLVWPILMGGAGIASAIISKYENKQRRVKSHIEKFIKTMWLAFGISLFISIFITLNFEPLLCYPIVLLFYGLGTFTTGVVVRFRPLVIGGVACWILAIGCAFVQFNVQLLTLAAGVMISYIVPGHLLQQRSKSGV